MRLFIAIETTGAKQETIFKNLVKPGITGLAQVSGRNALPWEEKFQLDVFYVYNVSFVLDAKIILKTIKKVIFRRDINKKGEATMHRFKGNDHL